MRDWLSRLDALPVAVYARPSESDYWRTYQVREDSRYQTIRRVVQEDEAVGVGLENVVIYVPLSGFG